MGTVWAKETRSPCYPSTLVLTSTRLFLQSTNRFVSLCLLVLLFVEYTLPCCTASSRKVKDNVCLLPTVSPGPKYNRSLISLEWLYQPGIIDSVSITKCHHGGSPAVLFWTGRERTQRKIRSHGFIGGVKGKQSKREVLYFSSMLI